MPGILVVEDDENLNRGITFSLKKSGYEVFSAESVMSGRPGGHRRRAQTGAGGWR